MPPPATAAAAARVRRRDDDADADVRTPEAPVLMEGVLRKQGARVHMWSPRYAVLRGPKLLMYRGPREEVNALLHPTRGRATSAAATTATAGSDAAATAPPPAVHKREFVLMSGCYVSEVRELPGAAGKGRSLWEFRLHWPEHVHHYGQGHGKGSLKPASAAGRKGDDDVGATAGGGDDSDEDEEEDVATAAAEAATATEAAEAQQPGSGPGQQRPQQLQRVAGQTARTARRQRHRAAEIEQAEQAHQSLVSRGATLAGVVVGGVVIGALTAGVGLVPYLGLVGTAAVVSGGAVAYTAAQAPSSRVVLSAETESEALRWKGALELQVAVLEGRRPPPPPEIDLQDVDQLIRSTAWRSAGAQEGLRVLEEERGAKQRVRAAALCRKMQTVVQATPIKVFLAFMATEGHYQPPPEEAATAAGGAPEGSSPQLGPPMRRMAQNLRTVQQIDDHTDVVHVMLQPLPKPPPGGNGAAFIPSATSYLGPLLLHPLQQRFLAPRDLCLMRYWRLDDDGVYTVCLTSVKHDKCPERPGVVRGALHGVLSIAPRKDYADFDDDLSEALVTYIVEMDPKGALAAASADRIYRPLGGLSLRMSGLWRAGYADVVLSQVLDVKEQLEGGRFKHRDTSHRRSSSLGSSTDGGLGRASSPTAASHSIGRSLKARLYASSSRQRKKKAAAAAAAAAAGMKQEGLSLSPQRRSVAGASPEEVARVQQVTAAALRARIAAKEYEVRRLEAELGRGGANPLLMNVGAGAVLMTSGSSTASPHSPGRQAPPNPSSHHRRDVSMDLMRQLQAHVDEAARLKAEYKALTGKDYGTPAAGAGLSVTTTPSSSPSTTASETNTTVAAPKSPPRASRKVLSPRRLLHRGHSHQVPSPTRVGAAGDATNDDSGVGSPLTSSAPAGPVREGKGEGEEGLLSARGAGPAGAGAVDDPFAWEDGVPSHWCTRAGQAAQGRAGITGEAVLARLFVVLSFCALLFLTLSMRRLLSQGGASGAAVALGDGEL